MTKISNKQAYDIKENIVLTDYFVGTDSEDENLGTVNYRFQDVQKYVLSGLSPIDGGTLKITEISYTGEEFSNASELANSLDPVYSVLQYHIVVFSVNGVKSLFKKQDVIIGGGETPVLESDFITIYTIPDIPLDKINEGNGDGIVIRGRISVNYGNIGLNAVDLSLSTGVSSTKGATAESAFTEGQNTTASKLAAHAEGLGTNSDGIGAHTEGVDSRALEYAAHAEGNDTESSGIGSHSEGVNTTASEEGAHSEGRNTSALAAFCHAEGDGTYIEALSGHGEGRNGQGYGDVSHVGGDENYSRSYAEFSTGHFGTDQPGSSNTIVPTDRLFNIGNGLSGGSRSNALTLLKNGLATLPSVTNALITAASGKAIVTKEFLIAELPIVDGSETKVTPSAGISASGNGTIATPYVIGIDNLQKIITYPADFTGTNYTISNGDNNYTIVIDNASTACTITIPAGLISKIGVGFILKGTADVTFTTSGTTIQNPTGLKIKGQYYQVFIEQELSTDVFYLLGNTKP